MEKEQVEVELVAVDPSLLGRAAMLLASCKHELVEPRGISAPLLWLAQLGLTSPYRTHRSVLAVMQGDVVGCGLIAFKNASGNRASRAELLVTPTLRRRGVGSALLSALTQIARGTGRGHLAFEVIVGGSGMSFLGAQGSTVRDYVAESEFSRSDAGAAFENCRTDTAPGLRLTTTFSPFDPCVFDELSICYEWLADAPRGQRTSDPPVTSTDFLREEDAHRFAMAHESILTLAYERDELSGFSLALRNKVSPETAHQLDTAVAPAARGRGIGRALKATLMRELMLKWSETSTVLTRNSERNTAMLSINQSLGFRQRRRIGKLEIHL